jgi:hypothetical protein
MGSSLEPDIQGTASNEILHQYLSAEKALALVRLVPGIHLGDGSHVDH